MSALFFTAQPLIDLSHSPWQMLQYTFPVHLQLCFLTCLFFSLCFTSAAAFLLPTRQPKRSSLACLQSILSSSLPVSDSCLHTASYTRHCFSSQPHPAFPVSPLTDWRSAQGRSSSHVLCEDAWQKVVSWPCLSLLSHQYFFSRYCWLTREAWCLMLQSDLCVAPVQWSLAGGCPQPPGTHDDSWHCFINKEPGARVAATQRVQTLFF